MTKKNKLLLIDGSSVAFRAFFALYHQIDRFKAPSGLHTNAIYGFHLMLTNLIERIEPTHVLVAFDAGKTTFRTKMYADYKGGRAKTPDEFREQFPFIREMLGKMGIKHYELVDYEADDIIGTLDKMAEVPGVDFDVTIVSGDKDLIQLTDANTTVEISKKGVAEFEAFTPDYLMSKMGLTPDQFIDLKALMGDSSDNIPGVTKIGEKTALKLLHEWQTLENLYENVASFKENKMKENLIKDKEIAFLSKTLVTIDTQAPIEIKLEDTLLKELDKNELIAFYDQMGFTQFKAKLAGDTPIQREKTPLEFQVVDSVSKVEKDDFFYIETFEDNYHKADILAFAWGNKDKIYVSKNADLLQGFPFPENTYDLKKNKVLLNRLGIAYDTVTFDAMLAKYLISTTEDNKIPTIAQFYDLEAVDVDEVIYGKGAKRAVPEDEVLLEYTARKIKTLIDSKERMLEDLESNEQEELLEQIEIPLANVLAKMEIEGIRVEAQTLEEIGQENEVKLIELTSRIHELAGEEFNINSPKQLGVILFEKLEMTAGKKTKTGYSTAVDVLETLAADYEIVDKILEYRQISKIQSTYVKGLIPQITEEGKIHTRYVQDLTQTGRLSSVEPNLQNIPVRLEEGRKLRKAFVASEDSVLLSSDYSQIELRVLAHISKDEHLIDAFKRGADIHASTAMRVFNIKNATDVTANDRRNAKAVNFGVVYGISDFGLARNLGIDRKEAKAYIETYFERYPGIKTYMEESVREARDKGFVETMSHRRRKIPDINARNFAVRGFAERTAINSPIQGSAADILKIAMINLDKKLKAENYEAKILLQVHDEIILDVPNNELDKIKTLVKSTMEEAFELSVPLEVDENTGKTWYEAK